MCNDETPHCSFLLTLPLLFLQISIMPAATGHAVMTAFAVLGNHRRVNESQKYPQITDAQLYIGSHNFTDAICAFRYYSGPGCQPYDGNNPAVYAIVVKVSL